MNRSIVVPKRDVVPWSGDTSKHSAAFKIFHYPFWFLISKLHVTDIQHVEQFGYLTTGDRETDRVLAREDVAVERTVAQMAQLYHEGCGFRLQNPRDGVPIYDMIYRHLLDWKYEIENNMMRREAPIADLRKFDTFAKEVHTLAIGYVKPIQETNIGLQFFEELARSRGGLGSTRYEGTPQQIAKDDPKTQHVSHTGRMAQMMRERERNFRN